MSVSTTVINPFIDRLIYRNCPVTISQKVTLVDLLEFEIVGFDVILGMDQLHSYYISIDLKLVLFIQFPNKAILEWKGSSFVSTSEFISYLMAKKMICKAYIYHVVWIIDASFETPTLESVIIVNEFPKVVLQDILRVPPER